MLYWCLHGYKDCHFPWPLSYSSALWPIPILCLIYKRFIYISNIVRYYPIHSFQSLHHSPFSPPSSILFSHSSLQRAGNIHILFYIKYTDIYIKTSYNVKLFIQLICKYHKSNYLFILDPTIWVYRTRPTPSKSHRSADHQYEKDAVSTTGLPPHKRNTNTFLIVRRVNFSPEKENSLLSEYFIS